MKKLLTLSVLATAVLLAGCANTTPTEEVITEPVAEEITTPAVEVTPVAEVATGTEVATGDVVAPEATAE